jgi:hypothetical protein
MTGHGSTNPGTPTRRRSPLLLFLLAGVVFLLLTELMLQGLALVSRDVATILAPPWDLTRWRADPRLGFSGDPEHPEHDRNGFRNPRVPDRVQVIALGDSNTYGATVKAREAWPRLLGRATGLGVYNMGFGGYGPVHSLILMDQAQGLEPELIIEAVYFGNDFYDAFDAVYNRGFQPGLRTPDAALQAAVMSAEADFPIVNAVARHEPNLQPDITTEPPPKTEPRNLREWVANHSALYGLLRRTLHVAGTLPQRFREAQADEWESALAFAARYPHCCEVFEAGGHRTLMTSRYRMPALDLADVRIREGLAMSLRALAEMDRRARQRGSRFAVVLIPTKELVFADLWTDAPSSFTRLVRHETAARDAMKAFLAARDIETVDTLEPLRAVLRSGGQPYYAHRESHPNALGHQVIAETVMNGLGLGGGTGGLPP